MLLCQACDMGYHYDCLKPPLKGACVYSCRVLRGERPRERARDGRVGHGLCLAVCARLRARARFCARACSRARQPGIPDDDWFCRSCLTKFGDAGPPAWTAFGPGDSCVACFEDEKRVGSLAKWVCKVKIIEGTKAYVHFPGTLPHPPPCPRVSGMPPRACRRRAAGNASTKCASGAMWRLRAPADVAALQAGRASSPWV